MMMIVSLTLVAAVLGASYSFFLVTPNYQAQTQVIAKISDSSAQALAGQVQANTQMATTVAQVMVSPTILEDVKEELQLSKSVAEIKKEITATAGASSQMITLTVSDSNPYIAAKIANTTASVFTKRAPKLLNVSNISVLATAQPNTTPTSPNKPLLIVISAGMGLILGVLIALVRTLFNTKVSATSDLEEIGISNLGSISKI
ncbi:polysaccharide biosynthesis protein [Anaerotruncus sp. X29]|nr:polysaccharide biosynthesis protein [Anaerotruncus sp. X29]